MTMGLEDWILSCGCSGSGRSEEIELVSDYHRKVTPLFRAIENLQWASVNNFLKTGYWRNAYFKDPVKPQIQVKTWMVRYEEKLESNTTSNNPNNNAESTTAALGNQVQQQTRKEICWKQLPMHAAIINNAPAIIIQKLSQMYPKALRCPDYKGNLPIHLAFRHGSNDAVLALLLQEYPESMNCRENNGLLPTECGTDIASPQPLRGALLKTTMSIDNKERENLQKRLQTERFFFDDRPTTPHQGNLSTKSKALSEPQEQQAKTTAPDPIPQQPSMLSKLKDGFHAAVKDSIFQKEPEEKKDGVTTPSVVAKSQVSTSSSNNVPAEPSSSPADSNCKDDEDGSSLANKALSPTAMASLQDLVSQALATGQLDPHKNEMTDPVGLSPVVTSPAHSVNAQSHLVLPQNSLLDSPPRQASAFPPLPQQQQAPMTVETTNSFEPQQQQEQQTPGHSSLQSPLKGDPIGHQIQQQQQLLLEQTATFEEHQKRLDQEVRMMEEKMTHMEHTMQEMHQREKSVRRELALTIKEVKHWKTQAKKASSEEEKHRLLTEMLQELVPEATTTAPKIKRRHLLQLLLRQQEQHQHRQQQQHHEDDSTAGSDVVDDIESDFQKPKQVPSRRQRRDHDATMARTVGDDVNDAYQYHNDTTSDYRQSIPIRKTKSELQRSKRTSSRRRGVTDEDQDINDDHHHVGIQPYEFRDEQESRDVYRDPPKSNRHSDIGVYYGHETPVRDHLSHPRKCNGRQARNNSNMMDEPPAIPLRRIQSETYNRASHHRQHHHGSMDMDDEDDLVMMQPPPRPESPRHRPTRMEPRATRIENTRRSYVDPHGTHVESSSFAPNLDVANDDDTTEFSYSLMEKIAALQKKQKKTRQHRVDLAYQRQQEQQFVEEPQLLDKQQQQQQQPKNSGVWRSKKLVEVPSSSSRGYYRSRLSTKYSRASTADKSSSAANSSSMSDSDFFPRD